MIIQYVPSAEFELEYYLPQFLVKHGECYVEDVCANSPQENENKKQAI